MHDYIIVGNGLAGAFLSYRLIGEGKSLVIFDDDAPDSAWKVAGGVWNALTFRRIVKGWMADEMTDEADAFYQKMQGFLKEEFYEPKQIVRIFSDIHFQNTWLSKSNSEAFSDYLSDESPKELDALPLSMPYGAGTVKKGGYVKLPIFMKALKNYLVKNSLIKNEALDFNQLNIKSGSVDYKDIKAKAIIFCEGYKVVDNPFFKWLPMNLTKGETLRVKNPGWKFESILNNGKHLIDLKDGTMGIGATFEWNEINCVPTEEGKKALLDHLEKNFEFKDWEVVEQKAGIRPTVSDRRPLTGVHPEYNNVYIFNGLGTKGVLIAPWMSKLMTDYLLEGKNLPKESDIHRYIKKHFN
jgi:glycine/D-amino acid oxidase-like deaminating enzyme